MIRTSVFIVVFTIIMSACNFDQPLFKLIPSSETGIDFENILTSTDSINVLKYEYFYNGTSVSVGDFNNDGLSDLFFSGNMVANKMYLNKGNLKFNDVSTIAGIENIDIWNSGVAIADVNNDGLLDIYVCANVGNDPLDRANSLFINQGMNKQGIPIFQNLAKAYGVEELGYSQNAAFLDYDKDGDLDLYVLTNYVGLNGPGGYHPKIKDGSADNNDQFYRNNGDDTFTNVTIEAGIVYEGYGLGISITDINLDGWPDIFIGNDYLTNDLIYINNQDGTFSNHAKKFLKHQSRFSMGNDIADINNDGLVDIFTLDMLPQYNYRKKTSTGGETPYRTYMSNEKLGYEYQYIRNMMHINNGDAPFSEVGQMMGIYQTEWSWSPLFADVDNDGFRDLLITNGFPRDLTDMDYIMYRNDVGLMTRPNLLLRIIPVLKLPNYGFKNHGDLTFTDNSKNWGLSTPSFSNGAAFADLDNDGDLDYVVTNIDDKIHFYENTLYSGKRKKTDPNYLRIKLKGKTRSDGLGTKTTIHYGNGKMQYHDHSIYRGYLSTVEDFVHFGIGEYDLVDTLNIEWPDGKVQMLKNIQVNQLLNINYEDAKQHIEINNLIENASSIKLFKEVSAELEIRYKHTEIDQIDFHIQKTLPHKFSQAGPGIAVGDINGDEMEDFIIGGSAFKSAEIFTQNPGGTFSKSVLIKKNEKYNEDEGLLLFDVDNDQDLDLYVVSGSYEFPVGHDRYKDRLYLNSGNGEFTLSKNAIPDATSSGSCVRASDFDGDGDFDLFIGGRVIAGNYPLSPKSYLLKNENGIFVDATKDICPALGEVGMITDALWTDFDNDGKQDLIVVGEFMAITIFRNDKGKLVEMIDTGIEKYTGWWNSISAADIDKDGDTDYIVGNLGLNNMYDISSERPLRVYAKDFDNNGSIDPILSYYIKSNSGEMVEYPYHAWNILGGQSKVFEDQFDNYKQYAETTMKQLLAPYDTAGMMILEANHSETSYIENLGGGKFKLKALPRIAQIAPINGIQIYDVDNDGNLDLILVGNDFGNEIISGRYDALNGLVLLGNGNGDFRPLSTSVSGFLVPGDAKALARLSSGENEYFIATQNLDSLLVYTIPEHNSENRKVYKPLPFDCSAELIYENGQKEKIEFYYGAGYLTQSSRAISIPENVKQIVVYGYDGKTRNIDAATL